MKVASMLLVLAVLGLAEAQQCTYEAEPNDAPSQATTLDGLGPDAVEAQAAGGVGTICLTGEIGSQDQDAFVWVVDEAAAQQAWRIEVQGPTGGLTQVDLFDVEFADNGSDVVRVDGLYRFGTSDGSISTSREFLVRAGRYVLGLSQAGVQGEYVVNLVPTPLSSVARRYAASATADGEFDLFAPLVEGLSVQTTIDEDASSFTWGLWLQAPLGTSSVLVVSGNAGEVGRVTVDSPGPARFDNLGLPAGEYTVNVEHEVVVEGAFVRFALQRQGRVATGTEVEPNDHWETATSLALGGQVSGVAESRDNYRIQVPAELAGSTWDLTLEAEAELLLRLYDPDGALVQERRGSGGVSPGLTLGEGAYRLEVSGRDQARYEVGLDSASPPGDGFEREPNDSVRGATVLGESAQARGGLRTTDVDYFRLDVAGEAQLYRVQVVGRGVDRLGLYDAAGQQVTEVRGTDRLRLDDLVLIPGPHYLRVSGSSGEYALRALSLGPAPELAPQAEAPRADEPLTAATAVTEADQPVEEALVDPPGAALPPLPPPPPGVLESEPNGDTSRAQRLFLDNVHVGRLAGTDDDDLYRFFLANDQYVRFEVKPAVEDSGWALAIDAQYLHPLASVADGTLVVERWLLAGDHRLELSGRWLEEPASGYYQLRATSLGNLGMPIDLEPNDAPPQASLLPADLTWHGSVGYPRGDDVYALPTFPTDSRMRLVTVAEGGVAFTARLSSGTTVAFEDVEGALELTLPGGEESYLYVRGSGEYQVELSFDSPLPVGTPLRPATGAGLELSLALDSEEATAFWHQGQRVTGTLTVTNRLDRATEVELTGDANDFAVDVHLPRSVQVGAGETLEVPVEVSLPDDMREDLPVVVQVQAATPFSGQRVGATDATPGASGVASSRLALRCEAPPVGAFTAWPLPASLLGRPNVLLAGSGATLSEGVEPSTRHLRLNDGRLAVSTGGFIDAERTPTFTLAGDAPVAVIGTVLNPTTNGSTENQLRRFRIETSLDGVSFEPAFEGELSSAKRDQGFTFDEPVMARYARLVALDSFSGRAEGYLGEWMLIAEDPALLSQPNLALPALGGHLVRSTPHLDRATASAILAGAGSGRSLDMQNHEALELVIGFHHARAAQISELTWQQPDAEAEHLYGSVEVAVSMTGAAGPWTELGRWPLSRDPGDISTIAFEEPSWARYVRLRAPKPDGADRYLSTPASFAIHEAPVADGEGGYRSALAAWGTSSGKGPYELLHSVAEGPMSAGETPNESADQATPLPVGRLVFGSVAVAEDVDWYRFTVPEGENWFELRLTGDPAIGYEYELSDMDGAPIDVQVLEQGGEVVVSAFVEPGDYLLRLEEPKRTVVFAWDTSGSVAPYQSITYASLAAFARGVDGEREAVQLMAYDDPGPKWLLPIWSHDPLRVQQALSTFDRNEVDSSNSEVALLTATRALADRPGTTAVLLITDAESPGTRFTPDVWYALETVNPRVFTFEVSSAGTDYAQDLMQDWAASNAGAYQMAQGVGSFEAGFERASCLLRRPKLYSVLVETGYVAPPGPGTLTVTHAPGAAQGAVEVIFDASGSMGQNLPSGEQRIVAAKRALETLVADVLPDGTPFALRAFGHIAPSSCETRLDVALEPLDRGAALAAVRALVPKLLSQTPLADSLSAAVDDLADASGPRTVILITDGEESCGGDPAAAAQALRDSGHVALAIVSLALDAEGLATFEALADGIGATYIDVGSYEALAAAIAEALVPGFEVYDLAGALVGSGRVGDTIQLPMGSYTVRVLSTPVEVFEGVKVPGDGAVRVSAGVR